MNTNLDPILIFATNIKTELDKQKLAEILNLNSEIQLWHNDLEDIDSVLRIESETLTAQQIISLIEQHDFECTELPE